MFDVIDTMAVFNAALCYEKSGDVDLAVARYKTWEATATRCLTCTSLWPICFVKTDESKKH